MAKSVVHLRLLFRIPSLFSGSKCAFSSSTSNYLTPSDQNSLECLNQTCSVSSQLLPKPQEVHEVQNQSPVLSKTAVVLSQPSEITSTNLAHMVKDSYTLQQLVNLGVNLFKLGSVDGAAEYILRLDFEKDIRNHIRFLVDAGVPASSLGQFITKNPFIFKEDFDDMTVRINYLQSKNFTLDMISRIITVNPKWLSRSVVDIDNRLGFFQHHFTLLGDQVRYLTTKRPQLITYNLWHVEKNTFGFREEMGFSKNESRQILLGKPKLFQSIRDMIVSRFNYIHNTMMIPHSTIAEQPEGLTCRESRLRERHEYLVDLNRAQYDPTKPGYVALSSLVTGNDVHFCETIAKTSITTYNKFLKSR